MLWGLFFLIVLPSNNAARLCFVSLFYRTLARACSHLREHATHAVGRRFSPSTAARFVSYLIILVLRFRPTFLIVVFPHIICTCMSYSVILAVHLRCNSSRRNYQVVIPMD